MIGGCRPTYAAALVVRVAEAEGDAADVFDDAVVAFGAGVAQTGLQGGDDGLLPGLDGAGEAEDLRDRAGCAEAVEPVERGGDLVAQPAAFRARE